MTETTPETRPDTGHAPPDGSTLTHLLCLLCYPEAKSGDKAVCGYVGTGPKLTEPDCLVCLDMAPRHHMDHIRRGDI